jgi:hypothetical protein
MVFCAGERAIRHRGFLSGGQRRAIAVPTTKCDARNGGHGASRLLPTLQEGAYFNAARSPVCSGAIDALPRSDTLRHHLSSAGRSHASFTLMPPE